MRFLSRRRSASGRQKGALWAHEPQKRRRHRDEQGTWTLHDYSREGLPLSESIVRIEGALPGIQVNGFAFRNTSGVDPGTLNVHVALTIDNQSAVAIDSYWNTALLVSAESRRQYEPERYDAIDKVRAGAIADQVLSYVSLPDSDLGGSIVLDFFNADTYHDVGELEIVIPGFVAP